MSSSTVEVERDAPGRRPRPRRRGQRLLRGIGWTLIAGGGVVLLYLVHLLFLTGLTTQRAQQEMLPQFDLPTAVPTDEPAPPTPDQPPPSPAPQPVDASADVGQPWAALWFERDGERIIHDRPVVVVEGTGFESLMRGPGHYRKTPELGADGNVGIAGHRTTYSAPFYHLDRLEPGDEIHVVDRDDTEWVYVVAEIAIVGPSATWVLEPDPLETGDPMLTLTTCHPRLSDAQRLIVFAELALQA